MPCTNELMQRSLNGLIGFRIKTTDGELGTVKQFLFDDEKWAVRYLVVQTGGLLSRMEVLISPIAMTKVVWQTRDIEVSLTNEQVEKSPDIDTQKPVSRQQETEYFSYYGWPNYWGTAGTWGIGPFGQMYPGGYPDRISVAQLRKKPPVLASSDFDSHLRSSKEVSGYRIHATDAHIGHLEDFIIDDVSWTIESLVIDTRNFWPGNSVNIAPRWVTSINLETKSVSVDLNKETIKNWSSERSEIESKFKDRKIS